MILLLGQVFSEKGNYLTKTGLALIAGGGLSNLYDRMKRGYVVDYFTINYRKLRKVIFNLADICIFAGGFLVILEALFGRNGSK